MKTVYLQFSDSALKHSNRPAVYWKLGNWWRKITYAQLLRKVDSLAVGLNELVKQGDRVGIVSENCPEWLITDLAINKLGCITVPIHATGNQSLIEFVIADSEMKVLFLSDKLFEKHQILLGELLNKNQELILVTFADHSEFENGRVLLFANLLKSGSVAPRETEINGIIYTSGTTGEPKGVILTNENLITNATLAGQAYEVGVMDKFLSFLPLSHVLERTLGSFLPMFTGASIAYAENIKKLSDNLREVEPTILIGVPRIYEKIQQKIFAEIRKAGDAKRKLFYWALKNHKERYKKKAADILVRRKVRAVFGGKLRFAVSGGAAINERIIRFFDNIGIVVAEGYGLTETSPVVAANLLQKRKFATVGQAVFGVEVRISEDKEVWVRGATVMKGYWRREADTASAFTDGWFRTGDLGFVDGEGYLTIIGRKKDIIVTSNGKKAHPERIETFINVSPYILQSVIFGNNRDFLTALIVPDVEAIKNDFGSKLAHVSEVMNREMTKINKELMPHEQIRQFHLLEKLLTIEDDELTPTLKVRRRAVEKKYGNFIEAMYK